jgi:hypothetical protein
MMHIYRRILLNLVRRQVTEKRLQDLSMPSAEPMR